ncbi:MAG: hypothetical protein WAQ24_03635 [Candidatus Saccharimonadales bacterium]
MEDIQQKSSLFEKGVMNTLAGITGVSIFEAIIATRLDLHAATAGALAVAAASVAVRPYCRKLINEEN